MKRDIKINYGILNSIVENINQYKNAIESISEVLSNINKKLEGENDGQAITALRNKYNDLNSQIDSCKEEINDLYNIFNGYTRDMTDIIRPNNYNAMTRVSRNDIYWNKQAIISSCANVGMTQRNASVYRGIVNPFADDDEKARERRNGYKIDAIHNDIQNYYSKLMDSVSDMERLYNTKIIPYENMDDAYKRKAKSLYSKYTNFFEGFKTITSKIGIGALHLVEGVASSLLELVKGVWGLAKGVVTYLGAGIGVACTAVAGDAPDCLKNCKSKVEEYNKTIAAIVKDPFLIVEGLSQSINDAYEDKGICYVTGYAAGEIGQLILLKKISGKIKGAGSAGGIDDAEKMILNSLDDANKWGSRYYDDWLKALTVDEREAITIYTGSDYKKINSYLRGFSDNLGGVDPKVIDNLNSALGKANVPYDMVVYRGTDFAPFKKLLDVDEFGRIDYNSLVGKTINDKAFVSTALLEDASFSNMQVAWKINVPAGADAAYVAKLSKYPNEAELLFNCGQSMIIRDVVVDSSGKLNIKLDLLK